MEFSQVRQGYWHQVQTCAIEIVPIGQLEVQVFPDKDKFVQDVQFVTVDSQVRQSPSQGTAYPEMLMYPEGVQFKHLLSSKINPESQEEQLSTSEQS